MRLSRDTPCPGIRISEITADLGEDGPRKNMNFAQGFDTVAQARTEAGEYAKRIVREQMTLKPAPGDGPQAP